MDTKPVTRHPGLRALPDELGEALSVVLELRALVLKHTPDDQRFVELKHTEEVLKKHKVDPDKFYARD